MINKVILIGNLGKDPEIRHLENGASVGKFPLATNENYRDKNGEWQQVTEWHDVVAWRALAERAEKTLKKGSLVYVEGKLTHRKYTDREGVERYISEVVANTFRILDRREGGSKGGFPDPEDEFKSGTAYELKAGETSEKVSEGSEEEIEDDLPF